VAQKIEFGVDKTGDVSLYLKKGRGKSFIKKYFGRNTKRNNTIRWTKNYHTFH